MLRTLILAAIPTVGLFAQTIDFTGGTYSEEGSITVPNRHDTYAEDGFRVFCPDDQALDLPNNFPGLQFHDGSKNKFLPNLLTLVYDGGPFDLRSITVKGKDKIIVTGSNGNIATLDLKGGGQKPKNPNNGHANFTPFDLGDQFLGVSWITFTLSGNGNVKKSQDTGLAWIGAIDVVPTPEPTTLALLGLGAAALVARRRRMG